MTPLLEGKLLKNAVTLAEGNCRAKNRSIRVPQSEFPIDGLATAADGKCIYRIPNY